MTLLLRYPSPTAPHEPQTFVSDAIYLRDHLLLDGGDHIISKYSSKAPETTVTRKLPKKIRRARSADRKATRRGSKSNVVVATPPSGQKGIENIIQEAARGLYQTGEKWGVAKALKGAVQGLQAANASPLRSPRRSLDSTALLKRIQRLEDRNTALSKMLAKAMDELWMQQKDRIKPEEQGNGTSDALSLAIAKVQFVQVYLENSTMQLPDEVTNSNKEEGQQQQQQQRPPLPSIEAIPESSEDPKKADIKVASAADENTSPVVTTAKGGEAPQAEDLVPHNDRPRTPTKSKHTVRPSLSESPYSWMLGDEQPKSEFVPTSPFLSAQRLNLNKNSNLFGDSKGEEGSEDDIFMGRRRK